MAIDKARQIYRRDGLWHLSNRAFWRAAGWVGGWMLSRVLHADAKTLCDDLLFLKSDIARTRKAQHMLRQLRDQHGIRLLTDLDLAGLKRSETIFILGSGPSVNELTSEDWAHVAQHDSAGFNFWTIHDVVPTYYFFEVPSSGREHDWPRMLKLLENRQVAYADVPLIFQYQSIDQLAAYTTTQYQDSRTALAELVARFDLYLQAPYHVPVTSPQLLKLALLIWRLTGAYTSGDFKRIIHHRASLSSVIIFAILAGYTEIVLIGIDLTSNQYFWEVDPDQEKYLGRPVPRDIRAGQVHATVDPALATFRAIPIDHYLELLDQVILKHFGLQLYIGSRNSKLYPRFPLYPKLQR